MYTPDYTNCTTCEKNVLAMKIMAQAFTKDHRVENVPDEKVWNKTDISIFNLFVAAYNGR